MKQLLHLSTPKKIYAILRSCKLSKWKHVNGNCSKIMKTYICFPLKINLERELDQLDNKYPMKCMGDRPSKWKAAFDRFQRSEEISTAQPKVRNRKYNKNCRWIQSIG